MMSCNNIAISVRGLGKTYTIASTADRPITLAETLFAKLRRPLRRPHTTQFKALDEVSFDIHRGDVVGIIGRNGAGKSTLLKVLSRITEPSTGEVDLYGRVGSLLEVGTGFHPELTGRENIFLNGAILGMNKAEIRRQFDQIVDFAGVEQFLDTPVKRYSSGMYVRLAFAVAAHLQSEILIVDEVLAVGDSEFQKRCLGKMQNVASDGRTVLFVSHNMASIQLLCNTGLMLRAGKVVAAGLITDVASAYLSEGIQASDGTFDLRQHPARVRHLQPWLICAMVCDADWEPVPRVSSSAPLRVRVLVDPPKTIRDPVVAIAIEDSAGRRIATSSTQFDRTDTGTFSTPFEARCEIPLLRLGPGRYLLSISVAEFGVGLIDSIDGAGWFEVEWDNGYPTGVNHDAVYGPVVVGGEWQLEEAASPQPV
jgi:lipopolysaccharide transport system ATP-binding protein